MFHGPLSMFCPVLGADHRSEDTLQLCLCSYMWSIEISSTPGTMISDIKKKKVLLFYHECNFDLQISYKGPPIVKLGSGAEFSMILDCKGALHSFGLPEYGQLGM